MQDLNKILVSQERTHPNETVCQLETKLFTDIFAEELRGFPLVILAPYLCYIAETFQKNVHFNHFGVVATEEALEETMVILQNSIRYN